MNLIVLARKPNGEMRIVDATDEPTTVAKLMNEGYKFYRVEENGQAVALVPLRSDPAAEVTEQVVRSVSLIDL